MLQLKNITKKYVTGELVQTALNDVSLSFRDNEFVAILGPSGSGKTTMLNIIGGLDRYDDGDLIINNISTKRYKNRDWDAYRNHTIGFVFQSYNLIPHQSILSNVELALTISGVSHSERRKRAKKALEDVGLGEQLHKRPNQMSGGQMQRVAIARALVNNPDILLADEPTGALDTETGIQVMELLKEVAKDRLVVMVTHNPELAHDYATRIVELRDGQIKSDSNPFTPEVKETEPPKHKKMGKASMSFLTALSLSFNNLRTKKGRTILTSFAGSIGIIGIALILSLSNGINTYINDIQKNTMSSYPITIQKEGVDFSTVMTANINAAQEPADHELDKVYSDPTALKMMSNVSSNIVKNNLTKFKEYLDNPKSKINQYIGENGVVYSYDAKFSVYAYDPEDVFINTNGSSLEGNGTGIFSAFNSMMSMRNAMMSASSSGSIDSEESNANFTELMPNAKGEISSVVTENYDVVYGSMPKNYDEVVLILDSNNEIDISTLYQLGILPVSEYKDIINKLDKGEEVNLPEKTWDYKEICSKVFYLVPTGDKYIKGSNGLYSKLKDTDEQLEQIAKSALKLKITGVIRPKKDSDYSSISGTVGYTRSLTDYVIRQTDESAVVKAQNQDKNTSVISGMTFSPKSDEEKIANIKKLVSSMSDTEKAQLFKGMISQLGAAGSQMGSQFSSMTDQQIAKMFDNYLSTIDNKMLISMYDSYGTSETYEDNMAAFGVVDMNNPSGINIYADTFEAKDGISKCIEDYNASVGEDDRITYTDYVGLLMSSVTTIINVISYVLIAFVAVSLIVSSIMIGIITYISVLERTKEIGILRAIGASKSNISQVFNAETFIIGLLSGVIGIGVTMLLLVPGNAIIHAIADSSAVNAILPIDGAIVLIVISVLLTLIGGLIPSRKAAKKDPVTALRSE